MEWFQLIKYLENECPAEKKNEVENWINNSVENRELFKQIEEMWKTAEKTPESINPDYQKAWENISAKTGIRERKSRTFSLKPSSTLMKIAAFLIVLVLLGTLIRLTFFSRNEMLIVSTIDGIKREVRLTDGTIVALNKNSKLIYPSVFKNNLREVEIDGEAFFKVAKDSLHPFIVHASGTSIKVLGTSFNIKVTGNQNISVSVLSGKVAFQPENIFSKRVLLTKGDKAVYYKQSTEIVKMKETDINFLSWQTGKLVFQHAPLDSVVKVISAMFNRKIEIAPEVKNRKITAVFEKQKFEEIIQILAITLDLSAEYKSNVVILKPKK